MADDVFFLQPAPGRAVRDPRTMTLLPQAGANKPRSAYWLRRIADGDVVIVNAVGSTKQKAKKATATTAEATTPATDEATE